MNQGQETTCRRLYLALLGVGLKQKALKMWPRRYFSAILALKSEHSSNMRWNSARIALDSAQSGGFLGFLRFLAYLAGF